MPLFQRFKITKMKGLKRITYCFILFFLFTQYFKRVTHLAKISHSTKWPSTNILNSLKTHVIEKSKTILYAYIHNRHTYILKNAVLSKIIPVLFQS